VVVAEVVEMVNPVHLVVVLVVLVLPSLEVPALDHHSQEQ
tara:strand:+ start:251 stop:370 length:120 start_codon:yes stop_codon:yes gene_type:complete